MKFEGDEIRRGMIKEMTEVPKSHPSIAAARKEGLAYRILLQNLNGLNSYEKMRQISE